MRNKMENDAMNLFIVDSDELMVNGLKQYLDNKFGNSLNISTFTTGESCLANVNRKTRFVVLAYFLNGRNGNEILKLIKKINPATEVIMLSSNDNIAVVIESFRNGANDFVLKGKNSQIKIAQRLINLTTYPVRYLVTEFGVSKYLAMFLLTLVTLGIVVFIAMKFIK